MKFNFIILIILLVFIKNGVFSQNKKEIQDKINNIISQEKYDYQVLTESKKGKNESGFVKAINNILNVIFKIFDFFKKIFLLIWKISPLFSIIIFIGLSSLLIVFIIWISKLVDLNIKKSNKLKIESAAEEGHFDYMKEFNYAKQMIAGKKFKEAISILINSLWLFYYHNKILNYEKSITNREYLIFLLNLNNFELIKKIILKAEKAVYYKEKIDERECEEILGDISEIFSQ